MRPFWHSYQNYSSQSRPYTENWVDQDANMFNLVWILAIDWGILASTSLVFGDIRNVVMAILAAFVMTEGYAFYRVKQSDVQPTSTMMGQYVIAGYLLTNCIHMIVRRQFHAKHMISLAGAVVITSRAGYNYWMAGGKDFIFFHNAFGQNSGIAQDNIAAVIGLLGGAVFGLLGLLLPKDKLLA